MKKEIKFIINEKGITVSVDLAKTLLDFIRIDEGLKGTKEGCREGDCGACTVLIGEVIDNKLTYKSINSCLFPIGNAEGKHIVTIEGLSGDELSPIQKEFNNEGASQCGFCTPGFVNSLTGYVVEHNHVKSKSAENAIAGNICRCTGYASLKRTANNVIDYIETLNFENKSRIATLVEHNVLPKYFINIEERLKLLPQKNVVANVDKDHQIIAGGTDLFVQRADSLLNTNISFTSNLDFNNIEVANNECSIGASVTIEEFRNSEIIKNYFPKLVKQLEMFASLPIRNSATIGGNLVNASPIGDSAIIFLALNAKLSISNGTSSRVIPLSEFYKGYKSFDLNNDEIIEKIFFALPNDNVYFNFEKVSKRTHLDIASVNSAIRIKVIDGIIKSASLSAGGVSPIPLYLKETSEFLTNKLLSSELIVDALDIIQSEISPISDIRGSDKYKRLLLNQLFKSHFIELFEKQIAVEVLL
jgi:xanthine dehydrogenase small subunit